MASEACWVLKNSKEAVLFLHPFSFQEREVLHMAEDYRSVDMSRDCGLRPGPSCRGASSTRFLARTLPRIEPFNIRVRHLPFHCVSCGASPACTARFSARTLSLPQLGTDPAHQEMVFDALLRSAGMSRGLKD